jgi:hypothetical protein
MTLRTIGMSLEGAGFWGLKMFFHERLACLSFYAWHTLQFGEINI